MKEKFIIFPIDHQIPNKDEQRGNTYYKCHNSWNHTTNACWGFRNVIHDRINKGILKFPDKNEAMTIDKDPFSLVSSINIAIFNLRALMESKKAGKHSLGKVWVPKYCMVHVDRLKNEFAAICIDPPSRRNSVKGIEQGIDQYNQIYKERKFSPKAKMNSPRR